MSKHFLPASADWSAPAFKVLASNDTGAASGNQAGVLIPKSLRKFFPILTGVGSSSKPTVDVRVAAELFVEENFVGTVDTRYQYQTWSGTRSAEARLTDNLGNMRNSATGGDILLIQRATSDASVYRLTLVRKSSKHFDTVAASVGNRRWGAL